MRKKLIGIIICMILSIISTKNVYAAMTEEKAETWSYQSENYTYIVTDDDTIEITKYTGNEKEVKVPAEIKGKKVTSIGNFAFEDEDNIESIELPKSVTNIGNYAFYCKKLKSINIPDTVTWIGDNAFESCESLETIILPSQITYITRGEFSDCKSLKSIVIPENVTEIAWYAFANCISLEEVTISAGVEHIGESAFYNCSSLKQIILPDGVDTIEYGAFQKCSQLEEITIPDSVTQIGEDVFSGDGQVTIYCNSDSAAHQYAVENGIAFKLLDQGFDLKEDGYCLLNANCSFGYDSVWKNLLGLNEYTISLERYKEVFGDSISKEQYKQIEEWRGNCFGMAATAVLFYKESISLKPYLQEDKNTLNSGGYEMLCENVDGSYYFAVRKESELTKLIERYQIWQDSVEFRNDRKNDIERYENIKTALKRIEEKEPLLLAVYWASGGHAFVVDSSRSPEKSSDGWYRIYLYDPNHPYFGKLAGTFTPIQSYQTANERYIDINIENGQWKMDVMVSSNSDSDGVKVGHDIPNSNFYFFDVDGYPTDFEEKATFGVADSEETGICYRCDNVLVLDEEENVVYWIFNGKVIHKEAEVEEVEEIGYIEGFDDTRASGKLILPKGNYHVSLGSEGMVCFLNKDSYAGIVAEGKIEVENTDSTKLKLYDGEEKNVNVVLEEIQGEEFVAIGTDIVMNEEECEISLSDNQLKVETDNVQEIDLSISTDKSEHTVKKVSTKEVENVDLDTGKKLVITPTNVPTNTPIKLPTNTPTNVPTSAATKSPANTPTDTLTNVPTNVSVQTVTSIPTIQPADSTGNTIKVGSIFEDEKEGAKYKVLSIKGKKGTVSYVKGNKNSKEVKIPNTIKVNGITYKVVTVEANAFKNSKKISKVVIGNNVTKIGANAFSGCKKLKNVTIGKKVAIIERNAFYKCKKIEKITLPKNVTKIGKKAFYGCKNLKSITVKSTKIKNVGSKAFTGIKKNAVAKVPKKKLKDYKKKLDINVKGVL
ncbi:MAG: leucine-rich repeat protein [Lachnospiraceae bacterium]|nr:leucine-rich repeat protein [Lachnospiraceae bacterium]